MLDPNKIALAAQIKQLRQEMEPLMLMIPTIAETNFKYYKSLLAEGFTEPQALALVKSHGMHFRGNGG